MKKTIIILSAVLIFALCASVLVAQQPRPTRPTSIIKPPMVPILPDMTVTKIYITNTSGGIILAGQVALVGCDWKRTGSQPGKDWVVRLFLDGTFVKEEWVASSKTAGKTIYDWTAVAGKHNLKCIVDEEDSVHESNEKNNKWLTHVTITNPRIRKATISKVNYKIKPLVISPQGKPDIIAKRVYLQAKAGSTITAGKEVLLSCDWKRLGPEPEKEFIVKRYIDGVFKGGNWYAPSDQGGTSSNSWIAEAGKHMLKCVVDAEGPGGPGWNGNVFEKNEGNNEVKSYRIVPALIKVKPNILKFKHK